MWPPNKTGLRRWVQSFYSQILQLKAREKDFFTPEIQKASLHFWQVMWMQTSKLKMGRSLSSLPTKCQQWERQIYLSVRISWEGQLSINLEIDDPQTSCSKFRGQISPRGILSQAKWIEKAEPKISGWFKCDICQQSSQGCIPVPEFTWNIHPWSSPH